MEQYTESIAKTPTITGYSTGGVLHQAHGVQRGAQGCREVHRAQTGLGEGYTRKGHVEFFTKQYDKALETYQEGLKHDPNNEELKDGLYRTHVEIRKGSAGQV